MISYFKSMLFERCKDDGYPIFIVLNSGISIECEMWMLKLHEDYLEIPAHRQTEAVINYPDNMTVEFYHRCIWIPYTSISFVSEAAS